MLLGKVVGNIVSTHTIDPYKNRKILMVKPVTPDLKVKDKLILAIDTVSAGIGDIVLIIDEGGSANYILKDTQNVIRTVIVGIVDDINYNIQSK